MISNCFETVFHIVWDCLIILIDIYVITNAKILTVLQGTVRTFFSDLKQFTCLRTIKC